jgi:galactose mutarotase-like enzyme
MLLASVYPVRLENDDLTVDILPSNGGKIASIRCRNDATEFVLSGSRYHCLAAFDPAVPFSESDCAGIDECLPSVSASGSETPGGIVPDHGDYWRIQWDVVQRNSNQVVIKAEGISRPILFTRAITLDGYHLRTHYTISNIGPADFPFHYACHPLLAVDPGDRIVLPPEIRKLNVYSSKHRLPNGPVSWPACAVSSGALDLAQVGKPDDDVADMLYTERLDTGVCGIFRRLHQKGIVMRFDVTQLPFLGLWMSYGGWPDGEFARKQFAVALEPTVAPFGALSESAAAGAAPSLVKNCPFEFEIDIAILGEENRLATNLA